MASPDGVGWPDESTGFSLASARDESRLVARGLGWPHRPVNGDMRTAAASTNLTAGEAAGAVSHVVSGAAGVMEHEQVRGQQQDSSVRRPDEPPARVKQALSAAVSRETSRGGPAGGEAVAAGESQGSGTVRTRERPAGGVPRMSEVPGPDSLPGPDSVSSPGRVPGPEGAARPG